MKLPSWLRPWHVYLTAIVLGVLFVLLIVAFADAVAVANSATLRPAHSMIRRDLP